MENLSEVSFVIAFLAGIATFVSPCVLPLLPSYLTFITGMSFEDLKDVDDSANRRAVRKATVLHSLFFILGFTVVFVTLGTLANLIGGTLLEFKEILRRIGGILIILFGIYVMGIFRIPFLDMEKKFHLRDKPAGYFGSSIVGVTFAAGWTPCIGPIIATILGLAVIGPSESPFYGTLLLLVFSIGLAVPFFLSSLVFNSFLSLFNKFKRFIPAVNIISGLVMIALGVFLFFTDFDTILMYIG